MRGWTKGWLGLGLALGVALLAACGGGADRTKAQVRLVNASGGYSALDLTVDDTKRFSSVGYGETADYVEIDPSHTDSVISRPDSATALVTFTPSVSKDNHYSILAYGGEGTLQAIVLDDNTGTPDSGKTLVRVVNAAPDAGNLDVYLTGSSDSLTDAVAFQSAAALGTVGSYVLVNSATWRLRVTGAGSKTDLRLDAPALDLPSEGVATLVITPGRGGVLVNALLLVDRGAIARADNPQARLRVVAGAGSGGAVTASVGGSVVMNAVGSPALQSYSLVSAGAPAVAVSVDGTAASLNAATLAAGGDYTLLVYGPPAAPVAAVIEDDNRLPVDSTTANLRLVHGVADLTTPLALSVDLLLVADGVAPGTASPYSAVSPSTTAELRVTTPGVPTPIRDLTDRTLVAGAVYSVFVVGAASGGDAILAKDR